MAVTTLIKKIDFSQTHGYCHRQGYSHFMMTTVVGSFKEGPLFNTRNRNKSIGQMSFKRKV